MSIELKPCPFCGGEAYIVPGVYRDGGYIENCAHVKCTKCGANGDTFSECMPFDVVEQVAAEAWNRRAEQTDSGTYQDDDALSYDESWALSHGYC